MLGAYSCIDNRYLDRLTGGQLPDLVCLDSLQTPVITDPGVADTA
ncbi:MAG TPA: hypothetical protein VHS59_05345 [Bacillota bacterium]|nr:hypothetical protein [Bacillota bacterium]